MRHITLTLCLITFSGICSAETRYITDQFEITMRTGMSTSNNIIRMLGSGEAVRLIEANEETRYSLVETGDGTQGYVISRYLLDQPSARDRVLKLENDYLILQSRSEQQLNKIDELTASLEQERTDAFALKQALTDSDNELSDLKQTAASAIDIQQDNQGLLASVESLQQRVDQLTAENADLSDNTELDWFVKGGGVTLIAFLVGILITRIRWRKGDSWGSF